MNLKKRLFNLAPAFALLATVSLTSCDQVSSDERFEELPAVEAKRVVLLEEFTGQLCLNCPTAHKVIEDLNNQFGDNIVAVSIHAGGNAFSIAEDQKGVVGLRLPEGETYAAAYNISSYPAGVVNRTSGVTTYDKWSTLIRAELERPSTVELTINAKLSDDGKKIEIETEATPFENITGNLQLWVTESGIVAMQRQPDGSTVKDYVHNHVFRGTVNGMDGEAVNLTINEPSTFSNSIDVKDIWNTANMEVVGFIYNSEGVVQAAKAHVKVAE